MATKVTIGMIDGSSEPFSFGVTVDTVTGATWPGLETAVGELEALLEGVSYGAQKTRTISDIERASAVPSANEGANREMAVRFLMEDGGGHKSVVSVGAPNLAQFPFGTLNTDYISLPNALVTGDAGDLVTWLEANARHPITGLGLTVYAIEKVGRNL